MICKASKLECLSNDPESLPLVTMAALLQHGREFIRFTTASIQMPAVFYAA